MYLSSIASRAVTSSSARCLSGPRKNSPSGASKRKGRAATGRSAAFSVVLQGAARSATMSTVEARSSRASLRPRFSPWKLGYKGKYALGQLLPTVNRDHFGGR